MIDITRGDIRVGGRSVRERNVDDLRREIGYVIQQIGLFPHRTIGENIATVPKLLGWSKQRIQARVSELLHLIGLPEEMARRYPAQLSGGQRQRVGVARALAADPPLMLMDEPFGAIDPINRERLQNEFLRLQAEIRKTVVFVTHDIDEAIKMGDRIAILEVGGHLAQYATPSELLLHPANRVRRGLRRRRPGAQAARADARARRPARGARQRQRRAGDRARDAVARRALGPARPRRAARPRGRRGGATRSARSASRRSRTSPPGRTAGDAVRESLEAGCAVSGLAQLEIRERGGEPSCVERNGFCPDWIADNVERYRTPLVEHIQLDADLGRDRLRDRVRARPARAPAALADPADHAHHRHPVHAAERRAVLPVAAAHRPRQDDGGDRACRVLAADHLPQRDHGARGRAGRGARRGPRHGPHAPPVAVARRAAARAAGDHGRAADRGHDDGRADRARVPGRRRRARRGDLRRHAVPVQRRRRRRAVRGARVVLDLLVLAVQKALTPWTRAAT